MTVSKPTNKFKIPCKTIFIDLDNRDMREPSPEGGLRDITLGLVISQAMISDKHTEGVSLTLLDRLEIARRVRFSPEPEFKVSTCEAIKKVIASVYENSPLIAGQALQLLGDEPKEL